MRALSLLLGLLVAACGRATLDPGPSAGSSLDLLRDLTQWQVEGVAATALRGLPEAGQRQELQESFDAGQTGVFGGGDGGSLEGDPGQRRIVLRTSQAARPRWLSRALPVDTDRDYTLQWRSTWQGVMPPLHRPKEPAGLSVLFFTRPGGAEGSGPRGRSGAERNGPGEPTGDTAPPQRLPADLAWRPAEGSAPWTLQERSFRAPHGVTHLQIVATGGPWDPAFPGSRVEIDDIELRSQPTPAWRGRGHDVRQRSPEHPLRFRARGRHPAHAGADEVRDVVIAPAPTRLLRRLRIPAGAHLELGYGLVPGSPGPAVTFEAALIGSDGREHSLMRREVGGQGLVPWRDDSIDLQRWGGQDVTLELRTSGRATSAEPWLSLARQPEARAAWTSARLEQRGGGGRLAILVVIDTLGARHASGWGASRPTTPNLQRIGEQGAWFEEARAPSPWTLPSAASYLTGLSPDAHGAGAQRGRHHWNRRPLAPGTRTLARRLRDAGWSTRAWINNKYLSSRLTGLDQGFERYVDYGSRGTRGGSRRGVQAVLDELEQSAGDRFLFVHLLDPHLPYLPPEPFQGRFIDPAYGGPFLKGLDYGPTRALWTGQLEPTQADRTHLRDLHEAAIAYADHEVGRMYDAALATGQELLFVVTSDHGEEFWEHGSFDHGHSLFDELMHVPLVLHRTGQAPSRMHRTVDASRLAGSILEFAGLDPGGLLPLPSGEDGGPVFGSSTLYGQQQRSVELEGWKYIARQPHAGQPHRRAPTGPTHLLFDLRDDRAEAADRTVDEPQRAAAMHGLLVGEALTGAGGAFFAWVGPGADPVELSWSLEGAEGWSPDVTDLPWPDPAGAAEPGEDLSVEIDAGEAPSTARLTVRRRPTLILLQPRQGGGAVTARVNGVATPLGEPITATGILELVHSMEPSVVIGQVAGELRAVDDDEAPLDHDLEALRALGYMD